MGLQPTNPMTSRALHLPNLRNGAQFVLVPDVISQCLQSGVLVCRRRNGIKERSNRSTAARLSANRWCNPQAR